VRRLNDYAGPVHRLGDAFDVLRSDGHTPAQRLPAILPGSLRLHHQPGKAWVYDEANKLWLVVDAPQTRRRLVDRVRGGRPPMWWRAAELRIERALRARFN
jgi:hypothetical protein